MARRFFPVFFFACLMFCAPLAGQDTQSMAGQGALALPARFVAKLESGRLLVHFAERQGSAAGGSRALAAGRMMVAVYAQSRPSAAEIASFEQLGLVCHLNTWTAPMERHPLGFFLAEMPVDRLHEVLGNDVVRKLGSAEGLNRPQNNIASKKIRANAAWSRGWTGWGVKTCVLDSGIDTTYAGTELPGCMVWKDYSLYPRLDDDVANHITGHGTHVAGTVAGRGSLSENNTVNGGGSYKGIAPAACMAFLKIGNDTTANASTAAVVAAMHDAVTVYNARVINMSYGGWGAYHDGSEPDEQKADWCFAQGVPVVISAGNSATAGRHAMGTAPANGETDFIPLRARNIQKDASRLSFNLVWYDGIGVQNALTLRYYDQNKNEIAAVNRAPVTESPRGTQSQYSSLQEFLPEGGSAWYVKVANASGAAQAYHIYEDWFEVAWWTTGSITFDAPSSAYTVGSPSTADDALSVAAYCSRAFNVNAAGGMRQYGQSIDKIANFSSRGPRVDGRPKPDIAAPGSALVSVRDRDIYRSPGADWVDNDGAAGGEASYVVMQGTSMAAPVVTGAVALIRHRYPELTPAAVRDSLLLHAADDLFTGAVPNANWGAGKVDVGFLADLPVTPVIGWSKVSPAAWESVSVADIAINGKGDVFATVGKPWNNESTTLYRSTNQGGIWTVLKTENGLLPVSITASGRLFTAQRVGGSVFRSSDNGASWTAIGDAHDYTSLALCAGDSVLVAGTWDVGPIASSDEGNTWTPVRNGLGGATSVPIVAGGLNGWIFACVNEHGLVHLYRCRSGDFLWTRSDAGIDTTKNVNSISVMPDGTVFAVVRDRVYRTTDYGAQWEQIAILNDYLQSVHALSNTTVLVGCTGAGVYRSTDRGDTWESFNDGLTTLNITGFDGIGSDMAYAGGSPGTLFRRRMGALDKAPILQSPVNGTANVPLPVPLRWTAMSGAITYTLEISSRDDFVSVHDRIENIAATNWSVNDLDVVTPYFWRVRAANNAGASPWSVAWDFTTAPLPPASPLLSQPADGESNVAFPVTFRWTPAQGAASYRIQVGMDTSFSSPVVDSAGHQALSLQTAALEERKMYFWRVQAANPGGNSEWSASWRFTTGAKPPAVPILLMPPDGIPMTGSRKLFWDAPAPVDSFHVQVSTHADFSTPIVDDSAVVGYSLQLPTLEFYTKYFWHVRSLTAISKSEWSPTWSFTTEYAAPVLLDPGDSAANVPLTPVFRWGSVPGATRYLLQVSAYPDFSLPIIDRNNMTDTSFVSPALAENTRYFWRVAGYHPLHFEGESSDTLFFVTLSTVSAETLARPDELALEQNHPNPASTSTALRFTLGKSARVTLSVFDVFGRCVALLLNRDQEAGIHELRFDCAGLAPGMYLYRLATGTTMKERRMMVVRHLR